MAFLKRLAMLRRDKSGNALAICAAALPLMIGGVGLAVDTVQISLAKRELQRAADSAAMAGAYAANRHSANAAAQRLAFAQAAVTRDLQINNDESLSVAAVVQNSPAAGAFMADIRAVRVQLSTNQTMSFLSIFDSSPQPITVEATATSIRDGNFCMLSLEDGNAPGVTVGGNAELDLGCGIATNSTSTTAITAGGSSTVRATPIMAVGSVPPSSNFASGTQLVSNSPAQIDPFASVPVPNPTNCRAAPPSGNHDNVVITPSTAGFNSTDNSICFNGWDIKGNVTLNFTEPTVVYINGGELGFGAQAQVTGRNVTFVLTSTNATSNPASIATIGMNGGAAVNITAPTAGPYARIAIYQDRRAPIGETIKFNGGSGTVFNGAVYFPQAFFEYNGGADMAAQCIQLVARRLDFRGNGTVTNSCTPGGPIDNFDATFIRLVA